MILNTNSWLEDIRRALNLHLPAERAHIKVAPKDRVEELKHRKWPINAKRSAVSFLLYPKNDKIYTLFMKRPEYPGVHSGQVSLPGGQKENMDPDLLSTAIREYGEETGIILNKNNYLAPLTEFYISPSNFLVQPYVAYIDKINHFQPNEAEVESLHEVSLEDLFLAENFTKETIRLRNRGKDSYQIIAPCYKVNDLIIWGATAMMISELQYIFEENNISTDIK